MFFNYYFSAEYLAKNRINNRIAVNYKISNDLIRDYILTCTVTERNHGDYKKIF